MRVLKTLSIAFTLIIQFSAFAAIKPITCQTNFGERSFTIEGSNIAFHQKKNGRGISSVMNSKTLNSHTGFKKTLYKDGAKHLINIENIADFNSDNDFLAITTPKGHKMTFPLSCKNIQ